MPVPDFYIVGAPKAGTTAMHEWLSRHPELHLLQKELHYWGSDLSYMYPRLAEVKYKEHLDASPEGKLIGEVAVWYLLSEKAAKEIKAFSPEAKIIIMLRDPADATPSLHHQMVYTGNEPLHDFEKALNAEADRRNREQLPDHYYCPAQGLCYTDVYRYAPQIQRYLDLFEPAQIHFISFREMKENTAEVFKKLLSFLGVDDSFETEFNTVNPSQATKNKKVQDAILTPGKGLKKVVKTMIPSKSLREKIKGKVWDMNTKEQAREPLSEEVKERLENMFAEERQLVESLTGVRL